jgi:hypothetical protein
LKNHNKFLPGMMSHLKFKFQFHLLLSCFTEEGTSLWGRAGEIIHSARVDSNRCKKNDSFSRRSGTGRHFKFPFFRLGSQGDGSPDYRPAEITDNQWETPGPLAVYNDLDPIAGKEVGIGLYG